MNKNKNLITMKSRSKECFLLYNDVYNKDYVYCDDEDDSDNENDENYYDNNKAIMMRILFIIKNVLSMMRMMHSV